VATSNKNFYCENSISSSHQTSSERIIKGSTSIESQRKVPFRHQESQKPGPQPEQPVNCPLENFRNKFIC